MPAGLQIINDGGNIQIDEATQNFVLTNQGSVTLTSIVEGGETLWIGSVSVTATFPLFFHRSSAYTSVIRSTNSGSAWTFHFLGKVNPGSAVPWYLFDVAPTPSENFGLEVFTASGARAFHSSQRPLRVVDVYSATTGDFVTRTLPAGRTYAVGQSGLWRYEEQLLSDLDPGPLPPGQSYYSYLNQVGGARINSSTGNPDLSIITIENRIQGLPNGSPEYVITDGQFQFVSVDVTNY